MNKWIPIAGSLVTRVTISNASSEFDIGYRDKHDDEQHYISICRIRDFVAEPYFAGSIEFIGSVSGTAGMNDVSIHRHYTTYDELRAVKYLWKSRRTLDDFIEEVLSLETLNQDEKERILNIMSEKTS